MIDADRLGFAVGDVSGKGVPAAIFMSLSRTVLKTVASEGGAPGDVLTRMNRLLLAEGGESMFVTVVYGSLDLASLRLDYSVAGHDGAYLRSGRGKLEQLPSLGPAVALLDGADFPTRSRTLAPGDLVFIATDGVTEAFNGKGDMFGGKRLEEMLGELDPPSAEAAVRAVTGAVDAFAAGTPQSDDITCLAIGVP